MKSSKINGLAFLAVLLASCGANDKILRSGRETPAPASVGSATSTFESDLESVRTADFKYIFVLRRKDGGVIDAADRSVIRAHTDGANRRVSADDGRAFIIGTNFQMPPDNIKALYDHFAVEIFAADPLANTNANTNK